MNFAGYLAASLDRLFHDIGIYIYIRSMKPDEVFYQSDEILYTRAVVLF